MEHYYIIHLHVRQIKQFSKLMNYRWLFYEAIDDPGVFKSNTSVGNNIIKNYCKGVVNFVCLFRHELKECGLLDLDFGDE
jgi:hypothetical protein